MLFARISNRIFNSRNNLLAGLIATTLTMECALPGPVNEFRKTPAAMLTVKLSGFRSNKPAALVAVYDTKNGYDKDQEFQAQKIEIRDGAAVAVFRNLPAGTYAVVGHHDENENGKVDYSLLRRTIEGIGVSNNVKLSMTREPSWEESRFGYDGGEKTIEIKLQYSF